ncbi:helix-turn-helix domain-containing protein [Ornithinimicrobium cavernae]|uniref:helix-turn-helix domain-containing protein n=1 Tax=Ornithinimicrobium cavernae TaxID=2666047 RepID=UPI000D699A6B|nr:helix-turn-helix transcriptional regulator [Ornithinimicrobium cavernae]
MATVTVRNLDDEVRRLLRIRAATNNRSMEAEIRHILTLTVSVPDSPTDPVPTGRTPGLPAPRHTVPEHGTDPLTAREHTVASLVSQGMSNRQIAAFLFLSERTVETHVGAILRKLDLRSRTALAVRYALRPADH